MAKTKQEQPAIPREPLPPEPRRRSVRIPEAIPQPQPGGLPDEYDSASPKATSNRALEVSIGFSQGEISSTSFDWYGPGLKSLVESAIHNLRDAPWPSDAHGTVTINFLVSEGIPPGPEVISKQFGILVSKTIPTELAKLTKSTSPQEPTAFFSPPGVPSDKVWVAARIEEWLADKIDSDTKTGQITLEPSTGGNLEQPRSADIIKTLETEDFSAGELRIIAEAALKKRVQTSVLQFTADESPESLLACLENLVDDWSPSDSVQDKNREALQLVLDRLAGCTFDYSTKKRAVTLINEFRKKAGLALFIIYEGVERRVSLRAKTNTGSSEGEFAAEATTADHSRLEPKPAAEFPPLIAKPV